MLLCRRAPVATSLRRSAVQELRENAARPVQLQVRPWRTTEEIATTARMTPVPSRLLSQSPDDDFVASSARIRAADSRLLVLPTLQTPATQVEEFLALGESLLPALSYDRSGVILNQLHYTEEKKPPDENDPLTDQAPKKTDLPGEGDLSRIRQILTRDLNCFFVGTPDLSVYRHDVIFDNRLSGQVTVGAVNYAKQWHMAKIYGNLRYVFVTLRVLSAAHNVGTGVIVVRWRVSGIKFLEMIMGYVPKRLWRQANLNEHADILMEAVSTFSVDAEGKIFKHVLDNKWEDREKRPVETVDKIKAKLAKLKGDVPAPSM